MSKTRIQIATHILYDCAGDNCECCDWNDEDRKALDEMSMDEAQAVVDDYDAHAPAREGDSDCDDADCYCRDGDNMADAEADAATLASAGWGTDEDYGYYGGDD